MPPEGHNVASTVASTPLTSSHPPSGSLRLSSSLAHSPIASQSNVCAPLRILAVPIEPEETFADLCKKAEIRFRKLSSESSWYAEAQFNVLRDAMGGDIFLEDKISSLYREDAPIHELQLYLHLVEGEEESDLSFQTATSKKRRVSGSVVDEAPDPAKKRRKESEDEDEAEDEDETPAADEDETPAADVFAILRSSQTSEKSNPHIGRMKHGWTDKEDRLLLRGYAAGWSARKILDGLPDPLLRSEHAVRARYRLLKGKGLTGEGVCNSQTGNKPRSSHAGPLKKSPVKGAAPAKGSLSAKEKLSVKRKVPAKAVATTPPPSGSSQAAGNLRPPSRAPSNSSRLFQARASRKSKSASEQPLERSEHNKPVTRKLEVVVSPPTSRSDLEPRTDQSAPEKGKKRAGKQPLKESEPVEPVTDQPEAIISPPKKRPAVLGSRSDKERWQEAKRRAGKDRVTAKYYFLEGVNREEMVSAMAEGDMAEIYRLKAQRRRMEREHAAAQGLPLRKRAAPFAEHQAVPRTNDEPYDEEVVREDDWSTDSEERREKDAASNGDCDEDGDRLGDDLTNSSYIAPSHDFGSTRIEELEDSPPPPPRPPPARSPEKPPTAPPDLTRVHSHVSISLASGTGSQSAETSINSAAKGNQRESGNRRREKKKEGAKNPHPSLLSTDKNMIEAISNSSPTPPLAKSAYVPIVAKPLPEKGEKETLEKETLEKEKLEKEKLEKEKLEKEKLEKEKLEKEKVEKERLEKEEREKEEREKEKREKEKREKEKREKEKREKGKAENEKTKETTTKRATTAKGPITAAPATAAKPQNDIRLTAAEQKFEKEMERIRKNEQYLVDNDNDEDEDEEDTSDSSSSDSSSESESD